MRSPAADLRRRSALCSAGAAARRRGLPPSSTPRCAPSPAARRCATGKVRLDVAPLVENGNTVPITVSVDSPMTAADHVSAIAVFNERNPQRDVAIFHFGAARGRATVSTRIRLATSQTAGRGGAPERRPLLVAQRRRDRHARRLHRGDREHGAHADQRAGHREARRGHRDPHADRAPDGERATAPAPNGQVLPRDIIRRFSCRYDGELVFSAELFPAIAANPYLAFQTVATEQRHAGLHLGRRQRLRADRDAHDHRHMRRALAAAWPWRCSRAWRRGPTTRAAPASTS